MTALSSEKTKYSQRGASTILMVVGVSAFLLALAGGSFLVSLRSTATQSQAQLRQDYTHREDAFLAALIHLIPNRAMGAMRDGSGLAPDTFTWTSIFDDAIELSNSRQVLEAEMVASLGLTGISGNTASGDFNDNFSVGAPDGENSILPGNLANMNLVGVTGLAEKLPATLNLPSSLIAIDASIPLIAPQKEYHALDEKGLSLSASLHSRYNLLTYPQIRFGYCAPGSLFVAKRNWWLFTVRTRINPDREEVLERNYVLSIYEIPSQIPLSASGRIHLGRHADGTNWSGINVEGPVYGSDLETLGPFSATSGSLAARRSISLAAPTSVGGELLSEGFDDLGTREARARLSQGDFYAASTSGSEKARSLFVDVMAGTDFLYRSDTADPANRASPVGWDDYARGANQAAMIARVVAVSPSSQVPTAIEFSYLDSGGERRSHLLERGENWSPPLPGEDPLIPFETEILENGRDALLVQPELFPSFLATLPDAATVAVNHSLLIEHDTATPGVILPTIPSQSDQLVVGLRRSADFSAFTKGFALVTPTRVYLLESFNQVPTVPPAGSGLPDGESFFPPVAIFSPEKRFGDRLNVPTPVHLSGRINTMSESPDSNRSPLDLKGANDDDIGADITSAELFSAASPAAIPPIHFLHWLVMIEEVHP